MTAGLGTEYITESSAAIVMGWPRFVNINSPRRRSCYSTKLPSIRKHGEALLLLLVVVQPGDEHITMQLCMYETNDSLFIPQCLL